MNPLFYSPRHMIIIRTQSRWAPSKVVGEDPQVTIGTDREPRALGLPIPNGNPFQQASLNTITSTVARTVAGQRKVR